TKPVASRSASFVSRMLPSASVMPTPPCSRPLEPDLFQRRRPGIGIDQHERGLGHPRPDAAGPHVLEDRAVAHPLVDQPLNLVELRFALLVVCLHCLLLEEGVEV